MAVAPLLIPAIAGAGKAAGTAAVTTAAIGAGGSLLGSALSSRSNSKATQAQMDATDKALAFERERDAANRAERSRAREESKAQWEARERIRLALLKRYGINVPAGGGPSGPRASGMTLGSMASAQQTMRPQAAQATLGARPGRTLADLADWSGFERNH